MTPLRLRARGVFLGATADFFLKPTLLRSWCEAHCSLSFARLALTLGRSPEASGASKSFDLPASALQRVRPLAARAPTHAICHHAVIGSRLPRAARMSAMRSAAVVRWAQGTGVWPVTPPLRIDLTIPTLICRLLILEAARRQSLESTRCASMKRPFMATRTRPSGDIQPLCTAVHKG